jgi:hypothetical protein
MERRNRSTQERQKILAKLTGSAYDTEGSSNQIETILGQLLPRQRLS